MSINFDTADVSVVVSDLQSETAYYKDLQSVIKSDLGFHPTILRLWITSEPVLLSLLKMVPFQGALFSPHHTSKLVWIRLIENVD